MSRVKRGVTSHAKHKKVYKAAKGFSGRRKNTIRAAKAAVEKAGQYAFRDRKRKKRTFRALWIRASMRPGRSHDLQRLYHGLSKSGSTSTARCCRLPSPSRRVPGDREKARPHWA